jgi:hypothetical protein
MMEDTEMTADLETMVASTIPTVEAASDQEVAALAAEAAAVADSDPVAAEAEASEVEDNF